MRRVALLVLATCSSGSPPDPAPAEPARPPPIHGAHGASIFLLAAADDGTAVISQDSSGGTRLWPTLDGTTEPIVVHVPAARELALAPEPGGFAIAALDTANQLEIVRVATAGGERSRVQVGGEPGIVHIAMTPRGVIATLADQTLVLYDVRGMQRGKLAPGAGERIANVAVRNGAALALIATQAGVRGRHIDLDGDPAWGGDTPVLAGIDPLRVAWSARPARSRDRPDHAACLRLELRAQREALRRLFRGKIGVR